MNNKADYDSYLSQSSPVISPTHSRDSIPERLNPDIFEAYMKELTDRVNSGLEETSKEMHRWVDEIMQLMGKEAIDDLEKNIKQGRKTIAAIQAMEVQEEMMQEQINQYTSRVLQVHQDIFAGDEE